MILINAMWNDIKSEIKRENKVTAPKNLERLQMTQEKKSFPRNENTGKKINGLF